jgi:hypothetical protein
VVETFPRKNYEQLWAALHARVAAIVEGGTYQKPDANDTTTGQEERRPKAKAKPKAKPATKRGRGRPKKKTKDDDEESMEVEDKEEEEEVEEDEEDEEAGKRSKKGTHHSYRSWLALELVSRVRVHCGSYEHG